MKQSRMNGNVEKMGLDEMMAVMNGLTKMYRNLEVQKDFWKGRILESPDDNTLEKGFFWIEECRRQQDKLDAVRSELRFMIEDETDEEYQIEY